MSGLVFVDTETTGLLPHFHEVWEIAVIERRTITHADQPTQYVDTEHVFHVKPDLTKADPSALRICRYYERTAELDAAPRPVGLVDGQTYIDGSRKPRPAGTSPARRWQDPTPVAMVLARLLDGAHLVGAVPSFDVAFLSRFLHRYGQAATWHYHLIDVEALAVGRLVADQQGPLYDAALTALPWDSNEISRALRVDVDPALRHTALGDARWARDLFDACLSRPATKALKEISA